MAELRSEALDGFSQFIGWCYFFSWSVSFWPQTILNYRRKRSTVTRCTALLHTASQSLHPSDTPSLSVALLCVSV